MIRTAFTHASIRHTILLLAGSFVALPTLAEEAPLTDKHFYVITTAQQELCKLDVADFKFSGYPKYALKPEAKGHVKQFAESQAVDFWQNSNSKYDSLYKASAENRYDTPEQKIQALSGVITSELCTAEGMSVSIINAVKTLKSSGVYGADRSACFITREQYTSIVKKKAKWHIRKQLLPVLAPQTVPACIAFYRDHYLAPEFAQLQAQIEQIATDKALAKQQQEDAKRAAEEAVITAAAAREAERQRRQASEAAQRQAKHTADAKRTQQESELQTALNVLAPDNARLVLSPDLGKPRVKGDLLHNFNEANKTAWDEYSGKLHALNDNYSEPPPFQKPVLERGEFEKTVDFEQRLAAATAETRAVHDQELALWRDEKQAATRESQRMRNNESAVLFGLLRPQLENRLGRMHVASAKYDADAEAFDVTFESSAFASFQVFTKIPAPIDRAPDIKKDISGGSVWAVFVLEKNALKPRGVLLRGKNTGELFHGPVKSYSAPAFKFSAQARVAYEAQLGEKDAAEQAAAERDRVEREKRQVAARERRRKERATWPAGAVATIDEGAFMCSSHKSAMKVMITRRANNPYVSFPPDCIIIPRKLFLADHRESFNGLAIVRLLGDTAPGYTDSSRIGY